MGGGGGVGGVVMSDSQSDRCKTSEKLFIFGFRLVPRAKLKWKSDLYE